MPGHGRDIAVMVNTTAGLFLPADPARHGIVIMPPATNAVTISQRPGVTAGQGITIRAAHSPLKLSVD